MIPPEFPGLGRLVAQQGSSVASARVLPGDVGRRRYLRLTLTEGTTVLGVYYPPEEDDARRRWLDARRALAAAGVRVPHLFAEDGDGSQLLEDFGPEDLATLLSRESGERDLWLDRAAHVAERIAAAADPGINTPFDAAFFRRELDLAREAVFDLWLAAPLTPDERRIHDEWAASLAREVAAHPRVLCHRDFHGNNLFPVGDAVAAIDFQDLRGGPDAYDLASLLWERTTLDWMTQDRADRVVRAFAARRGLSSSDFAARLARVLLQRAWKVCGTFARAVSQGRGETYQRYLPGELDLVRRLLVAPADCPFAELFQARLAGFCLGASLLS
ncbi:MAG TPA: phosphotransferase [Thermoanaerobaculia bacterium]|nr:phosphotransferase [Thermoanaerobaculia bacterium]